MIKFRFSILMLLIASSMTIAATGCQHAVGHRRTATSSSQWAQASRVMLPEQDVDELAVVQSPKEVTAAKPTPDHAEPLPASLATDSTDSVDATTGSTGTSGTSDLTDTIATADLIEAIDSTGSVMVAVIEVPAPAGSEISLPLVPLPEESDDASPTSLPDSLPVPVTDQRIVAGPLSLTDAVSLSYRLQPQLRVYLEKVTQAEGKEAIAFSPFLPNAGLGYSVGGFNLRAGGQDVNVGPGTPNFTFLPFTGTVPVGLNVSTGYEIAELRAQWLVTDFGRRMARYRQSQVGAEITRYQVDRAYQTVSNEVATAYLQVLRSHSLRRIAEEAVRRTEDELEVTRKLASRGVVEREKVLRAGVAATQARGMLDSAEAGVSISTAALNLAIGLNVSAPTEVVPMQDVPEYQQSLFDCLGTAIVNRRELGIAQLAIQAACENRKAARASFRPRVVADGALLDFQQSNPDANADLAIAFIKLDWNVFEGGRRIAETRIADSELRTAMAEAEALADTVAFQVTEAYRRLFVARRGIDRSKAAVMQSEEAYRLLRLRLEKGDATPADVTDAETALVRAQQDSLNSTYDYLTALVRLNFATGLQPVPVNLVVSSSPPSP